MPTILSFLLMPMYEMLMIYSRTKVRKHPIWECFFRFRRQAFPLILQCSKIIEITKQCNLKKMDIFRNFLQIFFQKKNPKIALFLCFLAAVQWSLIPETTIYLDRTLLLLLSAFFNIKKQKWDVLQEKITYSIFFHDYLSEDFFSIAFYLISFLKKKIHCILIQQNPSSQYISVPMHLFFFYFYSQFFQKTLLISS